MHFIPNFYRKIDEIRHTDFDQWKKNPSTQKIPSWTHGPYFQLTKTKTPFPFFSFPLFEKLFLKNLKQKRWDRGEPLSPYIVLNVIKLPDPILDSLDILVVSVVDLGTGQNLPVPRTGFGKNASEKSVCPLFSLEKSLRPLIYIFLYSYILQKKFFATLSMVPARVTHKFWPVPYAFFSQKNSKTVDIFIITIGVRIFYTPPPGMRFFFSKNERAKTFFQLKIEGGWTIFL